MGASKTKLEEEEEEKKVREEEEKMSPTNKQGKIELLSQWTMEG